MDPYFVGGSGQILNMTVHKGQTAYMECRVRNLGAKQVSWIRHSDVHILAVGETTFTTDERFSSKYQDDSGRFTLAIKRVGKSDEGTYECQISTKPTKSFVVHLKVNEPRTRILSEPALHVEQDSALNLTCIITSVDDTVLNNLKVQSTNHREDRDTNFWPTLFWYKDSQLLERSIGGRGKIMETIYRKDQVASNIYVPRATLKDSGNYTCMTSSASVAKSSVKVHVLVDGESPNAWKTSSGSRLAGDIASIYNSKLHSFALYVSSVALLNSFPLHT